MACSAPPSLSSAPVVLAAGLPFTIAVDAANVYWAEGQNPEGAIRKMPVGGGPTTTLATGVWPTTLTVAGTNVFWANWDSTNTTIELMSVPIAGGAPVVVSNAAWLRATDSCLSFVADATSLYAVSSSGTTGPGTTAAWKLNLDGGPGEELGGYQGGLVFDTAVDATDVYWVDWPKGSVMRVPIDGGAAVVVASGQSGPSAIAVDATNVYWTNSYPPPLAVMKAPKAGGVPVVLGTINIPLATQNSLAVDATNAYLISADSTPFLGIYPINGGEASTLVLPPGAVLNSVGTRNMAVDTHNIYWASSSGVMKLSKPWP